MYHFDKEEDRSKFWEGNRNKVIRYYFYVQNGLTLLNEFRYLIMSVLAIYALLKLEHWWLMPLMFFSAIPILLFLGWISIHHMEKTMEYLRIHFATHFTKYNINLQEEQLELLRQINNKLGGNNDSE